MDKRDNHRNTHRMGRYGYAGASRGVGRVSPTMEGTPTPAPTSANVTTSGSQHIVEYTSAASFEADVLEASKQIPVLVNVTATWCGPCRALAPLLADLAERYTGCLRVLKLDGDKDPALVQAYAVRAYPTLLVFKSGKLVHKQAGSTGTLVWLQSLVQPFLDPISL